MRFRRAGLSLLVGVAAALTACTSDPYPLPAGPPHAGQGNPALVGTPTQAAVLYLEIRPGDRFEFLGAEPVGVPDGASVRFMLSRPIDKPDGSHLIGEQLEALEGARAEPVSASPGPQNMVAIVAELTAARAGRYVLSAIRLRYRLNGGSERSGTGIDV